VTWNSDQVAPYSRLFSRAKLSRRRGIESRVGGMASWLRRMAARCGREVSPGWQNESRHHGIESRCSRKESGVVESSLGVAKSSLSFA